MATCRHDGVNSRDDPGGFTVEDAFLAKPLGTWSLSGAGMKASAVKGHRLSHRCGWSIFGEVRGDAFYGDPATETFPEE